MHTSDCIKGLGPAQRHIGVYYTLYQEFIIYRGRRVSNTVLPGQNALCSKIASYHRYFITWQNALIDLL